jgi:hypothetical protein
MQDNHHMAEDSEEGSMGWFMQDNHHMVEDSEEVSTGDSISEMEPMSDDKAPQHHIKKTGLKASSPKLKRDSGLGIPPLEMMAPNPLIGDSKELFQMGLVDNQTMCTKMSPLGLDPKTMQELVDATLDAIQLPGTSNSELADNTTDLIGALKEIAEDKQMDWTKDHPHWDVQWKASNWTSLLSIKTQVAFQE